MKALRDRILAEFKRLGIPPQESRAYLSLLEEDDITGYQLSKNAGIHSSKIYAVLKRLLERGFIIAADTQPVKYFPCAPDDVLGKIRKGFDASVNALESALESISNRTKGNELIAWNATGRADIIRRSREIIDQSTENIFLAVWPKELRPIRSSLSEVVKRGVKLHVVAYGATNFNQGTVYFHRPSDYPFRERGERRFVLTSDNKKAVIANFGPDGSGNGLWTENNGLVMLFRDFIIHEIYIVKIEEAFPGEIKRCFGKDWEKARVS